MYDGNQRSFQEEERVGEREREEVAAPMVVIVAAVLTRAPDEEQALAGSERASGLKVVVT